MSTTSVVSTGVGLIDGDDACLFQVERGVPAHTYTGRGHWFAQTGFVPGDIDGVGMMPGMGGSAARGSLVFSLLSNEGGFLDGDVLYLARPGEVRALIPEAILLDMLGLPEGNIDLDGLDFDDAGRLVFSLQNDLAGSLIGDIDNGDVLRLELNGSVTRLYSEAEVQLAMNVAMDKLGFMLTALGDVHGIGVIGDDLYVTLQAPSVVDGSILRLGANPEFVVQESELGLGGAELDAIVALGSAWDVGAIGLDQSSSMPGNMVHGEGHGFKPDSLVMLFMAGEPGLLTGLGLGGFGEFFINPSDPWLSAWLMAGGSMVLTDGTGSFSVDFQLPPGELGAFWQAAQGWSFQALDLGNLALTAPFRIKLF